MKRLVAALTLVIFVTGCATTGPVTSRDGRPLHPMRAYMSKHPAAKAVAIGVVVGAGCFLLMRSLGVDEKRAIVSCAAAGIAAGLTIKAAQDRQLAERAAVAERVGYSPEQGYVSGVGELTLSSDSVRPGQEVSVTMGFWALGPTPGEPFQVTRAAGLRYPDASENYFGAREILPSPFKVTGGGQWETTFSMTIPPKLPPGTYEIEILVEGPTATASSVGTHRLVVSAS